MLTTAILANMAILLLAILLLFFIRQGNSVPVEQFDLETLFYIGYVTTVGIFLMLYSVVVDGILYDYRFLLYIFSLKYLGPKVTVPSIFFIALIRFLFGIDATAWSSFTFSLLFLCSVVPIFKLIERYVTHAFTQLTLLIGYSIVVRIIVNLLFNHVIFQNVGTYFQLVATGIVMMAILLFVMKRINELKRRSEIDYLTKLPNNRKFYLDYEQAKERNTELILAVIDIDFFKEVNTSFGHLAGDEVLKKVTDEFRIFSTDTSRIYRMGGEEFICLMQDKSLTQAKAKLEVLRIRIAAMDSGLVDTNNRPWPITISVGITACTEQETITEIIQRADEAMYLAKDAGRNTIRIV